MAREVSLHSHPIIEPGVCGKCGTQKGSWFVDLGFDTVFNYVDGNDYTTWCDGIVYLCADCINSLAEDLFRAYNIFKRENPALNLTPLKLIPITLDKKEEDDGDSGSSSGVDSGYAEVTDENGGDAESDDGEAVTAFNLTIAEAV